MQFLFQRPISPDDWHDADTRRRYEFGCVICEVTHGPFCHVEVRFKDGRAFSSQTPEGVRFVEPGLMDRELTVHASYWERLDVAWEETPSVLQWCESKVGLPYDYVGAISSGIGWSYHSETSWFCSEICTAVAEQSSGLPVPGLLHPNAFYKWLSGYVAGEPIEDLRAVVPRPPAAALRQAVRLSQCLG